MIVYVQEIWWIQVLVSTSGELAKVLVVGSGELYCRGVGGRIW